MKCGIIAYGQSKEFNSKKAFRAYLMDWIAGTEGSEQERAVSALVNLEEGYNFTDTDRGTRCK